MPSSVHSLLLMATCFVYVCGIPQPYETLSKKALTAANAGPRPCGYKMVNASAWRTSNLGYPRTVHIELEQYQAHHGHGDFLQVLVEKWAPLASEDMRSCNVKQQCEAPICLEFPSSGPDSGVMAEQHYVILDGAAHVNDFLNLGWESVNSAVGTLSPEMFADIQKYSSVKAVEKYINNKEMEHKVKMHMWLLVILAVAPFLSLFFGPAFPLAATAIGTIAGSLAGIFAGFVGLDADYLPGPVHTLIEENAEISALYSALIGNFKDNLVDVGVRLLGGEQVGAHNISTIMASGLFLQAPAITGKQLEQMYNTVMFGILVNLIWSVERAFIIETLGVNDFDCVKNTVVPVSGTTVCLPDRPKMVYNIWHHSTTPLAESKREGTVRRAPGVEDFLGRGKHGVTQELIVRASLGTWEAMGNSQLGSIQELYGDGLSHILYDDEDKATGLNASTPGLFTLPVCKWGLPSNYQAVGIPPVAPADLQLTDQLPSGPPCKCGETWGDAVRFLHKLGFNDQDVWCRWGGVLNCEGEGDQQNCNVEHSEWGGYRLQIRGADGTDALVASGRVNWPNSYNHTSEKLE